MTNKLISIITVVVVIIGGGMFYGGMKYVENKSPRDEFLRSNFESLRNLSPEQRQQRFQEFGPGDHGGGFRSRFDLENDGAQPLSGEIIVQSEGSFTIKLNNDSTKIVFVSDSTQITKFVDGTQNDLNKGEQILVTGVENPDGSYTAKAIQIR